MSTRAHALRCDKCLRATPRRRLRKTAVGSLCPRCAEHLPKRLRQPKHNPGKD